MNVEQVKQIVDTIKTLNLNINDATTQKVADAILPVVKMYLIKDYIAMFIDFAVILFILLAIYKIVIAIIKYKKEEIC